MQLSQTIIEKIKKQKIAPKPKWEFVLKNYFIWLLGLLSLTVGSLAMAVIIYMIRHNDWDLHDRLTGNWPGFVFLTLPYFWVAVLIIFIIVVYYNIRHTRSGYHYNLLNIVLVSIILSVMLGQIGYNLGIAQKIDEQLAAQFPLYEMMFCKNSSVWNQPAKGLLIGQVMAPVVSRQMIVNDLNDKLWLVLMHRLPIQPNIEVGQKIKIIGTMIDEDQFVAEEIRLPEICSPNIGCQAGERSITCLRSK
ncbi:MAG: hypothetical protein V1765_00730 [bacterium]